MKCFALILSTIILLTTLLIDLSAKAADPAALLALPVKASKDSTKIESLKLTLARNPKDLKTRLDLAQLYQQHAEYDKMIELLRPVSDTLPRYGLLLLARAFQGQKDSLNEVRVLQMTTAQNEKDYFAENALGEAYEHLGKAEEAMDHFALSREANSHFLPAYEGLLRGYDKSKDTYESRSLLLDMIKVFGPKGTFYSQLCKLYYTDAFLDKAHETCETATLKDPKFAENHVYLALTLKDQGSTQQADKILKKAAQQFPKSEFAQWNAGNLAMSEKNFVGAYKYFDAAAKADGKSERSFLSLAEASMDLQKYPEALKAFTTACSLNRQNMVPFRKAVSLLTQKGEPIWSGRYQTALESCGGSQ
jgi:tetratricopeptide (TPR) repeat protein